MPERILIHISRAGKRNENCFLEGYKSVKPNETKARSALQPPNESAPGMAGNAYRIGSNQGTSTESKTRLTI